MATKQLDITATFTGAPQGYWITVDGRGVPMDTVTNQGSIDIDSPAHHILQYYFFGNGGDSIKIVGKVGSTQVLTTNGLIPAGKTKDAGIADFNG